MIDLDKQHKDLDIFWAHHQLIEDNHNQANFAKLLASQPCWAQDIEIRLMYLNVISREYPVSNEGSD